MHNSIELAWCIGLIKPSYEIRSCGKTLLIHLDCRFLEHGFRINVMNNTWCQIILLSILLWGHCNPTTLLGARNIYRTAFLIEKSQFLVHLSSKAFTPIKKNLPSKAFTLLSVRMKFYSNISLMIILVILKD